MNGLVNRAIEEFLRSTYGDALVAAVVDDAIAADSLLSGSGTTFGTEALDRAAFRLAKPRSEMFEDLGAWMTRVEPIRRLLRFSGRDFRDFLLRLDELPGRAHLVLPRLVLPRLQVEAEGQAVWLQFPEPDEVWQNLLVGLIRGMADDYGALSLISVEDGMIRIDIWDERFAEGRLFTLDAQAQPEVPL